MDPCELTEVSVNKESEEKTVCKTEKSKEKQNWKKEKKVGDGKENGLLVQVPVEQQVWKEVECSVVTAFGRNARTKGQILAGEATEANGKNVTTVPGSTKIIAKSDRSECINVQFK